MVSFPAAKINIGLRITEKRSDGFHDLQTVFYPVAIKDALEILPLNSKGNEVEFSGSGNTIDCPPEENICVKAYRLLQKDFAKIGSIRMHLHKHIPSGAGLGGGSSDAVEVLKLLNTIYALQLNDAALEQYAIQLGSDCPFFVTSQPYFATGRGNIFSPVNLSLESFKIVIVHPGIHISTPWAFSQIVPVQPAGMPFQHAVQLPLHEWTYHIVNDFEKPVLQAYPALAEIKKTLYAQGAVYASLSGSGSSIYGIFRKDAPVAFSLDPAFRVFHV